MEDVGHPTQKTEGSRGSYGKGDGRSLGRWPEAKREYIYSRPSGGMMSLRNLENLHNQHNREIA